jgi:hypothetical protein
MVISILMILEHISVFMNHMMISSYRVCNFQSYFNTQILMLFIYENVVVFSDLSVLNI